MKNKPKFIISGGGTGGHIYPAIAIANELKARFSDAEILFVGARDKMEMQKVPQAGYPIKGLWISGLQRKLTWSNLLFPIKFLSSLIESRKIVKQFRPDVVIGTGGFASGAVVKMAANMGIPTLIQEQNSHPGITNRMLAQKAHKICVAYDGLQRFFQAEKLVKTGNPVRQDLLEIQSKTTEAFQYLNLDPAKKTLLVIGGSLGSRRVNQLIESQLAQLEQAEIQVIWQCGAFYYEEYKKYNSDRIQVRAFIERMDLAFAAATVIISRAGASSVSELSIVGKPVLFIPSPNVAADHQTKNAKSIVDSGGALMLSEAQLEQSFDRVFYPLMASETQQAELAQNIKQLAMPLATSRIVDEIEKLIK